MREIRTYGSVWGAAREGCPYHDPSCYRSAQAFRYIQTADFTTGPLTAVNPGKGAVS